MADLGNITTGSFDSFEGVRIVVPGLTFAGLTYLTMKSQDLVGESWSPTIEVVLLALLAGLILNYVDIPKRSVEYDYGQPTDWIENRFPGVRNVTGPYLRLLNDEMPPNTRNRALYTGSLFRVGLEVSHMCMWFSIVNIFADRWRGIAKAGAVPVELLPGICVSAFVAVIFCADPRAWTWRIPRQVGRFTKFFGGQEGFLPRAASVALPGWRFLVLVVTIVLLILAHWWNWGSGWIVLLALGMLFCWSCVDIYGPGSMKKGSREKGVKQFWRLPSGAISRPLLGVLTLAMVLMCLMLAHGKPTAFADVSLADLLWCAPGMTSSVVVASGGHAKKLHGSYSDQKSWLEGNVDSLERALRGNKPRLDLP